MKAAVDPRRCYHERMFTYAFTYRGRDLAVRQTLEGDLALWLGKVMRKQCRASDQEPQGANGSTPTTHTAKA